MKPRTYDMTFCVSKCQNKCERHYSQYEFEKGRLYSGTILNLIEKQQKEIEKLKMKLEVEKIDNKYNKEEAYEEMIPRYKIREKIEELDEEIKVKKEIAKNPMDRVSGRLLTDNIVELEKTKKVLQSLLEEE